MGWSWALYFCHEALSSSCLSAMVSTGKFQSVDSAHAGMVGHRGAFPHISRQHAVCAPYVDNGN
eukprot:11122363-Karenia_brevis.AAC.1